ncbi:class II aldolase/adducin family protein [Novosphingobium nitrogenifigens DSM 19370]|uniref:Class II aldolase/adducin family protein n=1 Tax=Novosphingobium nitrogenifigens DSM 19370 TaxID=983920 RepID=F1ZDI8_9SPHN|nr:class II aldolase/adducin family protein [Novosphingobium nitrogenifigens]EGD57271.1 class II aldolase/adducin family protein [Novosphingobium nitrogenifigens DSM 19370]
MATVLERPAGWQDHRPAEISEAEWKTRVDLAAFYRIAAIQGYDDFLYTHITARVPGPDKHFLINPFGLTFDEITASSLVKVDIDGTIIGDSEYGINYAGYVIHSAIHAVREDAHWIAHFHTRDGMGASAHAEGLLPISQRALYIIPRLAYHDYEGVALNLDERERLQVDLGDKQFLLLRNHGTLALGATPGAAWSAIYQLEEACSAQVAALAGGHEHVLIAPQHAQDEALRQLAGRPEAARAVEGRKPHDQLAWEAVLRKVARTLPGFDT